MSNKIFSPNRFWLYFKQDVYSNYKTWLLTSLVAIGTMVVIPFFTMDHIKEAADNRYYGYFVQRFYSISCQIYHYGLFVMGLLITVISFNNFSSKRAGVFYLSLPATTFEKLFAHWVIIVPIFLIFYHLIYFAVSIITNYFFGHLTGLYLGLLVPVWKDGMGFIHIYIYLQSFFLAGTVLTGKSSFIKTTLTLFLIFIVFTYSNRIINNYLVGNNNFSYDYLESFAQGELYTTVFDHIRRLLSMLTIPLCYIVAFFFLKEKEV